MVRCMRSCSRLVVAGLLVSAAPTGWANGYRNPPEGAAAMGRAGGKIVHVDDPSAVVHNPANLAAFSELRTYTSYTLVYPDIRFQGRDGRQGDTTSNDKHIPSFFAAVPLETGHPLVFGFGMSSPWGQSTVWPKDGPFQGTAPHMAELMTLNLQPTLATRLGERLLVAIGVDVMYSELTLRQRLPLVPGQTTTVNLKGDGFGVGAHAAATLIMTERQRVAVTYRSPVSVDYDGDTGIGGFPGPLVDSGFESEIDFPSMVVLGYGVTPCDKLRLGVDVEWIEFSQFDTLPLDLGANNATGIFPPTIPQGWDDVWTVGLGADYAIDAAWTLRAGWVYLPTPIGGDTMAPTLVDDDRHVFSAGAGYRMRNEHAIDVAYAISLYEREQDGNAIPAYDGNYEGRVQLFQLSYNYLF